LRLLRVFNLSYSVDMLLRSAFVYEILNNLNLVEVEYQDENYLNIKSYFERRVKEIDDEHNKQRER